MPDYGGGSDYKKVSGTSGGSGYTTRSQAKKSRSRASERRRKAARQAAQRAAKALADQKKIDASKAVRGGDQARAVKAIADQKKAQANLAAQRTSRMPPEMSPRDVQQAAARQAQARFAAQADAARKERERVAALQRAANQQRSSAISQIKAAEQSANRFPKIKPQPRPEGMSLSRAKAGLYNLLPEFLRTDNRSGRTAKQQAFHDSIHGADARRKRRRRRKDSGGDDVVTTETTTTPTTTTELPPEIVDEFPPVMPPVMPPQFPQYPGMSGGLGAFGYSPASLMFESQQGAGQVPYYMAAARNQFNPNLSPAFQYAAQNYDILGGAQRVMPRPIEMMSARERSQIMDMGSNFSVPNYNSPYDQFDFFRNLVGGRGSGRPLMDMFPEGPPPRFGGPGKGAPRPMSQGQARAMGAGLGSLMRSGMMGMF